jgi:hypothetical protein
MSKNDLEQKHTWLTKWGSLFDIAINKRIKKNNPLRCKTNMVNKMILFLTFYPSHKLDDTDMSNIKTMVNNMGLFFLSENSG